MRSEAYHRIEINSNTMTCHQATQQLPGNNEKNPNQLPTEADSEEQQNKRKENMTPIVLTLRS